MRNDLIKEVKNIQQAIIKINREIKELKDEIRTLELEILDQLHIKGE